MLFIFPRNVRQPAREKGGRGGTSPPPSPPPQCGVSSTEKKKYLGTIKGQCEVHRATLQKKKN
jgi:hypothetical protein